MYLVAAIHWRFRGSFKQEIRKLLLVLLIFSVSYTYRLSVDFASISNDEKFLEMPKTRPNGYALLVFFMYFIGEMIPLFAIFWFHYRNNKTFEKKY